MLRPARILRPLGIGLASYFLLLLPVLLNGAPVFWPDSFAYLHGGSTSLSYVANIEPAFSAVRPLDLGPTGTPAAPAVPKAPLTAPDAGSADPAEERISAARSPYYAVFLAGASMALGLNGPVYLQALTMLLCGVFLIRAFDLQSPVRAALLLSLAAALTTAGWFCAILLPDFLAPIGLVATSALFAFWGNLRRLDKTFWVCMLAFSVISHTTHLAMLVILLPFAILLARFAAMQRVLGPTGLVAAGLLVGVLGNAVFVAMVERHFGYRPVAFPMVAASLIVDGTGRALLEETCPESGYVYCDYLDTQAEEVDQFLWSRDPALGVYSLVDRPTKDRMSQEQWRFLVDTLRYDFIGQFQASLQRMFRQVANNSLAQFGYIASRPESLEVLPEPSRGQVAQSAMFTGRFTLEMVSRVSQWIGWAALAGLGVCMVRARALPPGPAGGGGRVKSLTVLTLLIVIGFLINAALTGAASQPQGRYSARIFLLFPILLAAWASLYLQPLEVGTRTRTKRASGKATL